MDTSKEYIKMCEMAVEIQKEIPDLSDSSGQFFVCKGEGCDRFLIEDEGFNFCRSHIDGDVGAIWLPRQDQLQEMSSLLCNFPCQILTFLNGWIKDNKIYKSEYGSMEQLWLAFVMSELYQKIWNGKEWVKEK